ncbi:cysteine hydrolase, partial [Mesorhizobium sp. B2-6-4]
LRSHYRTGNLTDRDHSRKVVPKQRLHLIVTGCTTSVCVESTIRDAFFRDYRCILLTDCTSEPIAWDAPRSNHDASITLVQILFGWISTSDQFLKSVAERVHGRLELAE